MKSSPLFWFVPIGLLVATAILFLSLTGLPFLDLPNHATRTWIIRQLASGGPDAAAYAERFHFDFVFSAYILGDLFLSNLYRFLPLIPGALTYLFICYLSLPIGLFCYQKVRGIAPELSQSVFLLALYFASNWFFLSSYTNYCLSVGFVFFTLAAWEHALRNRTVGGMALFAALATMTFLSHLAGLFFLTLIIGCCMGVRILRRAISPLAIVASVLPLACLWAAHISEQFEEPPGANIWYFRTPYEKLLGFGSMFVRFDVVTDCALMGAVVLLVFFAAVRGRARIAGMAQQLRSGLSGELLIVALTNLAVYLAMPVAMGNAYDVDARALPYFVIFSVLGCLSLVQQTERVRNFLFIGAATVALVNFSFLALNLTSLNQHLVEFNQLIQQLPKRKRVLPISTHDEHTRVQVGLHNGELYAVYGHGMVPYIFSSSMGQPVVYFHYRHGYTAPNNFWYVRGLPVDWENIRQNYDILLIEKPFDPKRIGIENLEEIVSNDAAAAFAIQP